MTNTTRSPKPGQWLSFDGNHVRVVSCDVTESGVDLVVRDANGTLTDRAVTWDALASATVAENDGQGNPVRALASLWARWMQYISPRLRSASLATRALKPYAHQDEAVFDHMLPQPRLRFLLADEPGTGKTIMTGMYLVEGRRRGLIPGPAIIVVPAHLVPKWREELEDFFGIQASILTAEVGRDPKDLDPRVDVWIASLDLFTHNQDVKRKAAGSRSSWSLAVFDEAHRLTPTSRYLDAAADLAARTHHLLLLTATPHRGKEPFFRGLCNLLDPDLYPWNPEQQEYKKPLRPSKLSFLRRMKEELRDNDGEPLFKSRYAETISIELDEREFAAYDAVMAYAETWYGDNSALALSIYGKRAASSLIAAEATLQRRLQALSGSAAKRGLGQLSDALAEGLKGTRSLSEGFEDTDSLAEAEDLIVTAATKDKKGEIEAVKGLLGQIQIAIELTPSPSKWKIALGLLAKHKIVPGNGQLLIFTEFADTARWLRKQFEGAGFTADILEGAVDHRRRHDMQRRFLNGEFQILVSTDAGGEGINLQSAHVMIDWDIPWSLVRLEQRMGRLHRIGQKRDVYIYHLVAPATREGRVQEVMLQNIEAAAAALGGRMFDLLDAAVARASDAFDFASALVKANSNQEISPPIPDQHALILAGQALITEDKALHSKVDQAAAEERFRADRIEAINPVIVNRFLDIVAASEKWKVSPGPAPGIRRIVGNGSLPRSFNSDLVAADGTAVQSAKADDAGISDVVVLGPTEEPFTDLVRLAAEHGRSDILRGCRLTDTGSITNYVLFAYESEIRMHDGIRQVPLATPILIRYSAAGAINVSWEVLMNLKASPSTELATLPAPSQRVESGAAARDHLRAELGRQKVERLGWVAKAKKQLTDFEDSLLAEFDDIPAPYKMLIKRRRAQLLEIETVQETAVRLVGWADVRAGITLSDLGYSPDAEKIAIGRVIAELTKLGYLIDDLQTAGVGYDLLARNSTTGDQRCVEVKGFTESMGPVWLEQNEWAQALQKSGDYWLYVVDNCSTNPTVRLRVKNPAEVFGSGPHRIERFQIKLSQLKGQLAQG